MSPSQLCDENNPDWAPSLKLGYETSYSLGKRYKRAADRMVKKTSRMDFASDIRVDNHFSEMEDYPQEGSSPEDVSPEGELTNACIEVQTNLYDKDIEILQYEVHNLKEENSILKAELNKFKEAELDEPFFLEMMTKRFLTTWKLLYKLYLCM